MQGKSEGSATSLVMTMDKNDYELITQSLKALESRTEDYEYFLEKCVLLLKGLSQNVLATRDRIKNVTLKFVSKLKNYTLLVPKFQSTKAREIEKVELL